jgi:hypothetical protein
MRRAVCKVAPGSTVNVQSREYGRTIRHGEEVDLDQIVVPAEGDKPAQTLGDALSKDLELFDVSGEPPAPTEAAPAARSPKKAKE